MLKSDCRHFPGDRPCRFNKEFGQLCPDCPHYAPHGHRILITKLAALGDVLRTTAILEGVKQQFPHSYIVWLTLKGAADLLKGNPFIDEVWTLENDALPRLANEQFDLVLNPDADKATAGLASRARSKEKRGMLLHERGYVVPANPEAATWLEMGAFDQLKKANQKSYQQLLYEMLQLPYRRQEVSLYQSAGEREWAERFLAAHGWTTQDKLVGVNLGGGGRWKKKLWKQAHFQSFGREIVRRAGVKLLLIGGPHEKRMLQELMECLPPGTISSGHDRSLRETAGLIGRCQVFLTGDTLGFHLASALKIPTVLLIGPTSATELELYDRGETFLSPIECVGCYLSDCDLAPDCMELIRPEAVIEAALKWV